jgi:outer membrane immunogenic protein
MKKLWLVSLTGLALGSGSAFAAPPAPPAANWTGCYLDGGVGYGMWTEDHIGEKFPSLVQVTQTSTTSGRGWLGRIGGGCDYQIVPSFVIGVFADYDFRHIHGTFTDTSFGAFFGDENEQGALAVGGRVGYLVNPALLTYFEAGYTQARFAQINVPTKPPGFDIAANTYPGWFIGSGAEYSLAGILPVPGLFWRTEYRYASYRAVDLPVLFAATGAPTTGAAHMQPADQTITTGLVWRFNFAAPASVASTPEIPVKMPLKAPPAPPAPPAVAWTGCYLDGGAGYGIWSEDHYSETVALAATSPSATSGGRGWLGRLGAGCDYQFGLGNAGGWLIGIFADDDFRHIHGTYEDNFNNVLGDENERGAWAVGGRLGYLVTPSILAYFDGGYAQARFAQTNLAPAPFPPTPAVDFFPANTYRGAFVGGGTEYALNFAWLPVRGLFWRNEYRYASYGAANLRAFVIATGAPAGFAEHIKPYDQTFTTSLVWRFNWARP